MVQFAQVVAFAATLIASTTFVLADDIDETWKTPPFVSCVDGLGSSPSREAVYKCYSRHKSDKRAIPDDDSTTTHYLEFFDARATETDLHAECDSEDSLPKNFEIVTGIRSNAPQYCEDLKQGVLDAGIALVDKRLDNAVSKTLKHLEGGKGVLLKMAFGLTPQGQALMAGKKITEEMYSELCTKAITALATKDDGCTKDLHAYNEKKDKKYQVTGARSGGMDISLGDTLIGFVTNMYTKP
ncbi:uncharacterized protein BKCO1_6800011 [Diplodia corticola]|uniref:Pectinesterase inhibitor domain-containing protein n=1 Tax=Diplodia corticola TaxID=236234 RepID=A0A1J9RC20_9PEZI|nr:uncharacterized protein BKCO1_6800011 [Diplodia corticola]OJD30019.1 hypothetical protein BKCO1_6800011 [Diplodia corticola]